MQLEGDFVVIFQGFTRTKYNVSAGSHEYVMRQWMFGKAVTSVVGKSSFG